MQTEQHAQPDSPAAATAADAIDEHETLAALNEIVPAGDLVYVPSSLHEQFQQVPEDHRRGIAWDKLRPQELYADRPIDEQLEVVGNVAGAKLRDAVRVHFAQLREVGKRAHLLSEQGIAHEQSEVATRTAAIVESVLGATARELERHEQQAAAELHRYEGAHYAAPERESVLRERWADAWGAGPAAVAQLFDGMIAAEDLAGARVLARIARMKLAASTASPDSAEYRQAKVTGDLLDELERRLEPDSVRAAKQTRAAVAQQRERLAHLARLLPKVTP